MIAMIKKYSIFVEMILLLSLLVVFMPAAYAITVNSTMTWQSLHGPYGENETKTVAVSPSNANVMYAGIPKKGLYESKNAGKTWQLCGLKGQADFYQIIFVNGVLYVATGEIYRSTDQGKTWQEVVNGLPQYIDPVYENIYADQGNLYAVYSSCIFRLDLGTDTWKLFSQLPSAEGRTLLIDDDSQVMYAAAYPGIYKSVDHGVSWQEMNNGLPGNITFNKLFLHNGILYAINQNFDNSGVVYKSTDPTDNQGNWVSASSGINSSSAGEAMSAVGNTLYLATFGGGLYQSNNEGQSWEMVSGGVPTSDFWDVATSVFGSVVVATEKGIYIKDALDNRWVESDAGIDSNILSVLVTPDNDIYAGSKSGVIFKFDPKSSSWNIVFTAPSSEFGVTDLAIDQNGTLFAIDNYQLYSSKDGETWSHVTAPKNLTGENESVKAMLVNPNSSLIYVGTISDNQQIYFSNDEGATWKAIQSVPWSPLSPAEKQSALGTSAVEEPSRGLNGYNIGSMAISNNFLYVTTIGDDGTVQKIHLPFGQFQFHWQYVGLNSLPSTEYTKNDILVLNDNNAPNPSIYVAVGPNAHPFGKRYDAGIYLSKDAGASWMLLNKGIPETASINKILSIDGNSGQLIASSCGNGVFMSNDYGQSWLAANNNLPTNCVNSINLSKTAVYAATDDGVYALTESNTTHG